MDIKGFFDSLDHDLTMLAISRFTSCKWTLLYIKRWLKADMILSNGVRQKRTKGTPQGGVISPLIANIFLHLCFDKWMHDYFPKIHFERYADDIVVHCRSHKQLKYIESEIRSRFQKCKLELCEEKTKIVYCKNSKREYNYPIQSFDFLGFTFRPRSSKDKEGNFFVSFTPAVSRKSLKAMRSKIKSNPLVQRCFSLEIYEIAKAINPMIQGWINYYGKFRKSAMSAIYDYINGKLIKWARNKYKHLKRRKCRAGQWLRKLYTQNPYLFAHWKVWKWVAEY